MTDPFAQRKRQLDAEQYRITQEAGTERAFNNRYWDHKDAGIYIDIVSGEALFSSLDKYDSGSGWPSFTRPLLAHNLQEHTDHKLAQVRTEVRSVQANSHLGHVFDDGPAPTGLRYCINSAALDFIPVNELASRGYAQFLPTFEPNLDIAILAGGCFWGMQELFAQQPGVIDTQVGYTGGHSVHPSYNEVCQGNTGHAEAVQIVFQQQQTHYQQLLRFFFSMHDPTTINQQGNDRGSQYRSAIFVIDQNQRQLAQQVISEVDASAFWNKPIVTEINNADRFYIAEDYHQNYLQKHPGGYHCHYVRNK